MTVLLDAPPSFALDGTPLPIEVATPPRFVRRPAGRVIGDDALDCLVWCEEVAGLVFDDWQELVLIEGLAVDEAGYWAADEAGYTVPRQNGKNDVLAGRELYGVAVLGDRKVIHSAHQARTAAEHQERLVEIIESSPELAALVAERGVRTGNNDRSIRFRNGSVIQFMARSKSVGRGFSADLLVIDEAQELSDSAVAALLPSGAARADGQRWIAGTVPGPLAQGEYLRRVRQRSLDGKRRHAVWIEWGCAKDVDLDDTAAALAANPAAPHRITLRAIGNERAAMSDADFARERLGVWDLPSGTPSPFPADQWEAMLDHDAETAAQGRGLVFGVDARPDRSRAAIVVAAPSVADPERLFVEPVAHRSDVEWLQAACERLALQNPGCTFVVDRAGPCAWLIDSLTDFGGCTVVSTGVQEMATAVGITYDRFHAGLLTHNGNPDMAAALAAARKRAMLSGKAWGLGAAGPLDDITPAVGMCLAVFGCSPGAERREVKPKRASSKARRIYTYA